MNRTPRYRPNGGDRTGYAVDEIPDADNPIAGTARDTEATRVTVAPDFERVNGLDAVRYDTET